MTEPNYSSDHGLDFYILGLLVTGIGSVATGVNLIVTILTMRAPGMGLRRVPLFVWMVLVNGFLVIAALPSLNVSLATLWIDRHFMASFFDPTGGGQPVLWQHLFWSFGHPEVYIMVLPAWGMISEIIPVFSRKPIYGYGFVAMSTVGIFALRSDEPERWAPLGAHTAIVRATYPCPPGHRKETCPDFACVRELDETAIVRALDGLLVAAAER